MHFNSIAERKAHPQAGLIPGVIWGMTLDSLFIDDDLILLMQCGSEELAAKLERLNVTNQLSPSKAPVYLAGIALSHPDMSDGALLQHARLLGAKKEVLFRVICVIGKVSLLSTFIETENLTSDKVQAMIKMYDYDAFRSAARGGDLPVMERLIELAPGKVQSMIAADRYGAFREAAGGGHLVVMERLIELAPDKVQAMIKMYDYEAFRRAAEGGQLSVMERLIKLAPDEVQDMIKANYCGAFREAAYGGHLSVMERLIALVAPDNVQAMIKMYNYYAFRWAAGGGHLVVMERLIELAPDNVQDMIKAEDYEAFRRAAEGGHLSVMERLIELAPDKVQDMIAADRYGAFREAAGNRQLSVMERLIELAPDNVQDMIAADDYRAFRWAARSGDLVMIEVLIELAPDNVQAMIAADDYGAFRWAARGGHLSVMEGLIVLAPGNVQDMIAADRYGAFRQAAGGGHLVVMERLIELAPDNVQDMIKAEDYGAFRAAAEGGHGPVVNKLLFYPTVFAYAEMHDREYGDRYVRPFVAERLAALKSNKVALETQNPHAVFDVTDPDEAKRCFYMIRHFIRRNDPALLDDIRFLLDIPAVEALAHTEVTPGAGNELLRLALTVGNQSVAGLLLNIEAVRTLAERNNFYRAEARGQLDLAQLARNPESSMRGLGQEEEARCEQAIAYYQPTLTREGASALVDQLRATLRARYAANPAKVGEVILPLEFAEFKKLRLNDQEQQAALEAYYQHQDHTALRYLMRPNPWMSPDAGYVIVNPDDTTQRWSTFGKYKPFIAMLWLAASDKDTLAIDGHTLEGRIDHFINELALIGRAHNWDRTRVRAGKQEEYDDLDGDRPSCYSGVKRRLFQSVVGHPLLQILTNDIVEQERREFTRQHFESCLNGATIGTVKSAWDDWKKQVEEGDDVSPATMATLKKLNITAAEQDAFIDRLKKKYGLSFSSEFEVKIKSQLKVDQQDICHVTTFYEVARHVMDKLPSPAVSVSSAGVFGGSRADAEAATSKDRKTHQGPKK